MANSVYMLPDAECVECHTVVDFMCIIKPSEKYLIHIIIYINTYYFSTVQMHVNLKYILFIARFSVFKQLKICILNRIICIKNCL